MQKKIHFLMLSSNIVRQTTFEIESLINKNNLSDIDNHVFISGLARSGTTILLNSIHKSNYFASLKYDDMPFILAPNLWSKITPNKKNIDFQERAHKDGIQISTKSPEAFEEIFWKTFYENNFDTHKKFRKFVSLVLQKNKKKRYISKNNQNIKRLEIILKIFPKSKILILFRNPIHQAKSLLNQHKKFINYSKKDKFVSEYMKWIGHHEFGPNYIPIIKEKLYYNNYLDINHWIEQWYLVYRDCFSKINHKSNVKFICYEKLCESEKYFYEILKNLDIKEKYKFNFNQSLQDFSIDIDDNLKIKTLQMYEKMYNFN